MSESTGAMRVDIVSDVVCPWCVIGYYQLEKAAKRAGTSLHVVWHPFELNPNMVEEGENLREHLAAKYGTSRDDSKMIRERLAQLGQELGFAFNFTDEQRMWNTFRAHQLISWAEEQGKGHETKLALFEAYFSNGENISNKDTLGDIAQNIGLNRAAALAMLEGGENAEEVREKANHWTSQGISGVPAMIFDHQHLVTGAQGEDNYQKILEHLKRHRVA
ncbi:DsbA family oxidoreductase [Flexibacterium corallicola]|uniref:DsbA family oxidoreductase n=1 Tax=Flexibacterium corallicola TaxID=3037259 RepID=UPI00286EF6CA|nr:DsbA family oxidoreductase [Pseudovibrio sp. M1P-2-3]